MALVVSVERAERQRLPVHTRISNLVEWVTPHSKTPRFDSQKVVHLKSMKPLWKRKNDATPGSKLLKYGNAEIDVETRVVP